VRSPVKDRAPAVWTIELALVRFGFSKEYTDAATILRLDSYSFIEVLDRTMPLNRRSLSCERWTGECVWLTSEAASSTLCMEWR
jgi:hypothetical protein